MTKEEDATLEHLLDILPDDVADALTVWRKSTLDREKAEALLYLRLKAESNDRTATEIKALINADDNRYGLVLIELTAESEYNRKYEKLMGAKKRASLRLAF